MLLAIRKIGMSSFPLSFLRIELQCAKQLETRHITVCTVASVAERILKRRVVDGKKSVSREMGRLSKNKST